MRDYQMVRRRLTGVLAAIAAAVVGVPLVSASVAVAAPAGAKSPKPPASGKPKPPARRIGHPRVTWSASKIEQGIGQVQLAHGRHLKDQLHEIVDLGPASFHNDDVFEHEGRAVDEVHSTNPDGTPIDDAEYLLVAQAPSLAHRIPFPTTGGDAHLDWTQAYDRRRRDASLSFQISSLKLDIIDDNGPLVGAECPALTACDSIRAFIRYHLRAWVVAGGHEVFNVGGGIFADGHEGSWLVGAATSVDSAQPFWTDAVLTFDRDSEHDGTQSHFVEHLVTPLDLEVPLKNVPRGALFEVHLTMDAVAIDDRGRESAAEALIEDPPHAVGLVAHGLTARAAPPVTEPPVTPRPPARCRGGARPHSGTLQFSRSAYSVGEANGTPLVLVTRVGGSRGATSATIDTHGGSAVSGRDFTRTRTVVRFENGDASPRLVEIPILEDHAAESPEDFKVSLANVRCSKLGKQRSASVTILDDDQPPPAPPAAFTIGGTVDGLQGSGLVLSDFGAPVPVSANGSFTFPGTVSDGQGYEVNVATQPTNPDQICTVDHGTGQVSSANVTDIAVHCVTQVIPSGLDSTFGDHGRTTTPGAGEGRAVLIQPGGGIVTVGEREVAGTVHTQFGATRHDAAGHLDPSFGTGGIATTSLGGNDDRALDAALMPDGGFVAVGQADPAGLGNIDFGVVRYDRDGHPDPSFNGTGIETTDLTGHDDTARAVAVQPDGKIIAAGTAQTAGANSDFALVRYNPDGTLDKTFDGDGIVTTDLGTFNDDATDIAIQPDGKIVVVGDTGDIDQKVALARYLPSGKLDPTFNSTGTVVGIAGVANGVAVTPGGTILVAGYRGGPKGDPDPYVASYGPNGRINLGFGNLGVAQAHLSDSVDSGDDLTLDANGNIVLVGSASNTTYDMALARFKPDGTLDKTLTVDFHATDDSGHALAIDPQSRIVAAGTSGNQFALMRANL